MSAATADAGPRVDRQPLQRLEPRVRTGELVSTVGALLLLPLMFLLDWYGAAGPGVAGGGGAALTQTGWSALTELRWAMLLTVLVTLAATLLHASQRGHGARTDTGAVVSAVASVTTVLVWFRVLVSPPDPSAVVDIKLGAYLGLLALTAIALGGLRSLREERGDRRQSARIIPESRTAGPRSQAPLR